MPTAFMTHDSKFWDRIADSYFASPIKKPDLYEEKLRQTQALMKPHMRMLEFGCGTGGTAVKHAPHVKSILATDISEQMLEIGRSQAAAAGATNIDFQRADIADYKAEPESFDMVLGMSILHLVKDPGAVIQNVHSWLKPGGYFITSTACLGDKMAWFRYVGPIGRAIGKLPYVNVFKAETLVTQMKAAGFTVETRWQPDGDHVLFLITRKSDASEE